MAAHKHEYRLEIVGREGTRIVDADLILEQGDWLIFCRRPAQGGPAAEYWRVRSDAVICMETKVPRP